GPALSPGLLDRSSNSCHVHDRAAFETLEVRMSCQQLFRVLIGGFEALGGFNRRRNAHDLRILLSRALVSGRGPAHVAASSGVTDEGVAGGAATHARRELIH